MRVTVLGGTTDVTDSRVMAFGAGAPPRPIPITVAIDSTGLSPDRPSGGMVGKWDHGKVRGWYKLHAAYDKKDNWRRMQERGIEFIANNNGAFDPGKRSYGCGRFRDAQCVRSTSCAYWRSGTPADDAWRRRSRTSRGCSATRSGRGPGSAWPNS